MAAGVNASRWRCGLTPAAGALKNPRLRAWLAFIEHCPPSPADCVLGRRTVARTGECSLLAFDLLELNGWDVRREPHRLHQEAGHHGCKRLLCGREVISCEAGVTMLVLFFMALPFIPKRLFNGSSYGLYVG